MATNGGRKVEGRPGGIARPALEGRTLLISALAVSLGALAGGAARLLTALIQLFTNLAYFHRVSWSAVNPWDHRLGWAAVLVPVLGGLIVGLMARHGSRAIRGHGIPEAMEQVLYNRSRIQPRLMVLKPLSAAIAIGTGCPFGVEGPIIATGGAMGSFLGQLLPVTADERKTLLAAGAAAGMAATFGSPVSAVLLAIELLLFEYSPRSFIPVALASCAAMGIRAALLGSAPVFPIPPLSAPAAGALAAYALLGAACGALAVPVTRSVRWVEEGFLRTRIGWVWWPALGGLAVGLLGLLGPRSLGVGYDNITDILGGRLAGLSVLALCGIKLASWSLALGSGTSGGTLAPLFTIGGGFGAALGLGLDRAIPALHVDPRMAALVGMAALFTGASRALLTSVVFVLEATHAPGGAVPLLAGCSAAYVVSSLLMEGTIMTEKMVRRGAPVPVHLASDHLAQVLVGDRATRNPATLPAAWTLAEARRWIQDRAPGSGHQAYPVVEPDGRLGGLLGLREILMAEVPEDTPLKALLRGPLGLAYEDQTLREAADQMVHAKAGRLMVVDREHPDRLLGILTLRDLLDAHQERLDRALVRESGFQLMPDTQVFRG